MNHAALLIVTKLCHLLMKPSEPQGDENTSLVDPFAEIQKYTDNIKFDSSGEISEACVKII